MRVTWDDVAELAVFSTGCYWIGFGVALVLDLGGL